MNVQAQIATLCHILEATRIAPVMNDRRRKNREYNKDNRVMTDDISTIININRASDHEDINKGHRVPHDRNVRECAQALSHIDLVLSQILLNVLHSL
jgi:hypothetical protein